MTIYIFKWNIPLKVADVKSFLHNFPGEIMVSDALKTLEKRLHTDVWMNMIYSKTEQIRNQSSFNLQAIMPFHKQRRVKLKTLKHSLAEALSSQLCEGGWRGQSGRLLALPLPNMTSDEHNDGSSRSHKPPRLENRLPTENTCWNQSFPPFESTLKGRQSTLDDLETFLKVWPQLCI